jgi:hypothetical protein
LVLVEPLFCLLRRREWKQAETDARVCEVLDDDGVT